MQSYYFIGQYNDVGEFVPGLTFEYVESEYFRGYHVVNADTRPFAVLRTLDRVEGLYLLEGGFRKLTLKGSELFEVRHDAEEVHRRIIGGINRSQ